MIVSPSPFPLPLYLSITNGKLDVILSLTRTRSIGYLRDMRRMTVALSRARLGLYVLGRKEVFEACFELEEVVRRLCPDGRAQELELVMGEMYPPKERGEEVQEVKMEGVEHVGQYVYEMTKTKVETLKEEVEEIEVDEGDEELFNRFMPQGAPEERISLADKILEKIAEHEAKLAGHGGPQKENQAPALPEKVIEVYSKYARLQLGFGARKADAIPGLEFCSRDTSLESSPRRSRSSPLCATGRRFCSSPAPTRGPPMLATRRPSFSRRRSRRRHRSELCHPRLGNSS